jgi:hypothetical protein
VAINTNKPKEFSDEDIAAFEGKDENRSRGKVQVLKFPSDKDPDKPACFWVAKPNRKQLAAIADAGDKTEKANDLIVNTGILAGDVDQLEYDDEMYFGVLREIQSLVQAKKKI